MRGGISTEMQRYAKANNPHLHDYDPDKETSYILYLDANNLYGWAMNQPLPVGGFKWMRTMPTKKQIMSWQAKRQTGFILEVDLEYPQELHDRHNNYPLAPETTQVPGDWYSPYQQALASELGLSKDKTEQLLLTLRDKEKYVLHYRNLQLYLSLGMRLKKVHSVLALNQKTAWSPISGSTPSSERRPHQKNFFKLMNNSVFGKTMENLRNRTIVKLVQPNEHRKLQSLLSDPLYAKHSILGENLAGIQMHKDHILMNRPVYTGMCVLDLSKTLMYDFYYNHLEPKYGSKCQLLYTDTDSLLLDIKTEDVYKDMGDNLDYYDTSDFPKDNPLHSQRNKKVIGKMKDECSGAPISEAVCLRSKMYSILLENDKNIKKAKGTTKAVTKKQITHQNYKDALFKKTAFKHGMNMLRSKNHEIF